MTACSIEGCLSPHKGRGYCGKHYANWRRTGEPVRPGRGRPTSSRPCSVRGCETVSLALSFCNKHYLRFKRHGDPLAGAPYRVAGLTCDFPDCTSAVKSRGWCALHYWRWWRHGDPATKGRERSGVPFIASGSGYAWLYRPEHPNANGAGCVRVHTFVVSELIGRPILPGETIHHKNGVRDDNRPENLELWASSHPRGQRIPDLIEHALAIIGQYGSDPDAYNGWKGNVRDRDKFLQST